MQIELLLSNIYKIDFNNFIQNECILISNKIKLV